MFAIFRLIFRRNKGSVLALFFVILLASTGFLLLKQLTLNIETQISKETRPLFGADIRVSARSFVTGSIIERVTPFLSGVAYSYAERTEFSTTLLDKEGKTGLVNIVAYSGTYPQKWVLTLSPLYGSGGGIWYVASTRGVIDRFASGNTINIDSRDITITDEIIESSDLGFSFWTENHLVILPKESLSGSMLISSGSRLEQELLLSFEDPWVIEKMDQILSVAPGLREYRVRSYTERSERTFETTEELTNYILLILVVAAIFAGIILRSAHDALFSSLSHTLRIIEILWFQRRRQFVIFVLLYSIIIPLAFITSIGITSFVLQLIQKVEAAKEFQFFIEPILFSLSILSILILVSFFPAWSNRFFEGSRVLKTGWYKSVWSVLSRYLPGFVLIDSFLLFLALTLIVYTIFWTFSWSVGVVTVGLLIFLGLIVVFSFLYRTIYRIATPLRSSRFYLFDGIRSLVRPLTPTLPLTASLGLITTFFVVFSLFSLSFRERLITDTKQSANIFAINILDTDIDKIREFVSPQWEIYDILRARITRVNNKPLEIHLGVPEPTPEFTREFNITTATLAAPIVRGVPVKKGDEVSVDEDFSKRLQVDIGDTIEFSLSGKRIRQTVVNIKKSVREGFRPFFYFSFDKKAFESAPKTYFAALYTTDIEWWKKEMLLRSGPHVTFIDVDNILRIARDISTKILAVISLFFGTIWLFGILAILSLFSRLHMVEAIKSRLYTLFGAIRGHLIKSFYTTRVVILIFSLTISLLVWSGIYLYITSSSAFLDVRWIYFGTIILLVVVAYALLLVVVRPQTKR